MKRLSQEPKSFKKKWRLWRRSSEKKRKRRHPVAGYGSETQVYHPLAWVSFIHYTPELPLDKLRVFVYNKGTMLTRKTLRKRIKTIHDRSIESLEESINLRAAGEEIKAASYTGRYLAYHDSWYLINSLMNPTKKGGD